MRHAIILRTGFLLGLIVGLGAGSSGASAAENPVQMKAPAQGSKVGEVVKQPLKDLNVYRPEIPAILLRAKSAPYALPAAKDCGMLRIEIDELDKALGPDLDLAKEKDGSVSKKISDQTFDLARGALSGFIPYRGIVRRVTGAEKHARAINEALLAGAVRRSYLKGYGEMLACDYPSAPKREQKQASAAAGAHSP